MSMRQSGPFDSIARKWLALAQRRKAAFIDMWESGRWKHYYVTRAAFDNRMREINFCCDRWASLAGHIPQEIDLPAYRNLMWSASADVLKSKFDAAIFC